MAHEAAWSPSTFEAFPPDAPFPGNRLAPQSRGLTSVHVLHETPPVESPPPRSSTTTSTSDTAGLRRPHQQNGRADIDHPLGPLGRRHKRRRYCIPTAKPPSTCQPAVQPPVSRAANRVTARATVASNSGRRRPTPPEWRRPSAPHRDGVAIETAHFFCRHAPSSSAIAESARPRRRTGHAFGIPGRCGWPLGGFGDLAGLWSPDGRWSPDGALVT